MLTAAARSQTWPACMALMVALVLAGVVGIDPVLKYTLILAMIYGAAVVGLDIFSGYLGQPAFSQGAFVAIGAYTSTILRDQYAWSWPLALVACVLAAVMVGAVLGLAMARLSHFGAAMVAFFFAFALVALLSGNQLAYWTHSATGLRVPPMEVFGLRLTGLSGRDNLYWLAVIVLGLALLVAYNYANSRAGRALRLVKKSENAAAVLGVAVTAVKVQAFAFSSAVAATAGFLLAPAVGFLAPESFDANLSVTLFAMAAVGGIGSLAGPVLGSLFYLLLPPIIGLGRAEQGIFFAAILLIALIVLPRGFYGMLEDAGHLVTRRLGRSSAASHVSDVMTVVPSDGDDTLNGAQDWGPRSSSAPAAPALVVSGLSLTFGGVHALKDVGLGAGPHAIHAIVGPNGAGKTSLLNCISGVYRPTSGSIVLDGVDLVGRSPQSIRRFGVSRTFQTPTLVGDLNVVENVSLGLYGSRQWSVFRDIGGRLFTRQRLGEIDRLADEALDLVAMPTSRRSLKASQLSLADQRMADIARGLAGESRVLLLDEPTSGLDEREIQILKHVISSLRERDLTILVISHHLEFVRGFADETTVLDFGVVLGQGRTSDVFANERVIAAFTGARIAAEPAT